MAVPEAGSAAVGAPDEVGAGKSRVGLAAVEREVRAALDVGVQLGGWDQNELAGAEDLQLRLDMLLEVPQAHADRGGGFGAADRDAR